MKHGYMVFHPISVFGLHLIRIHFDMGTYQSMPLICHWYTVKCSVDTHAVIFHLVLRCFSLFCFENWNSQLIAIYFTASVRLSLLLYMPTAISIVLLTHPRFYLLLTIHHHFFIKPAFMREVCQILKIIGVPLFNHLTFIEYLFLNNNVYSFNLRNRTLLYHVRACIIGCHRAT
jgi:hypothetical protein